MHLRPPASTSDPVAGQFAQMAQERYRPWSRATEVAHWVSVAASAAFVLVAILAGAAASVP